MLEQPGVAEQDLAHDLVVGQAQKDDVRVGDFHGIGRSAYALLAKRLEWTVSAIADDHLGAALQQIEGDGLPHLSQADNSQLHCNIPAVR